MQEIISCPSCRRKLQVPEVLLGQDVQCPTCGATFVARLPGQAPSAPAPRHEPRADYPPGPDEPRRHEGGYDPGGPYRRPGELMPHRAGAVLTLGILSLVSVVLTLGFLSVILGPIGWVMGTTDLSEMRAGRMDREGESSTNGGRVCAMIGTLVGAVAVALCCLLFAISFMEESRHRW